jgi:DNA-binding NarL/FixJ family response regulator
MRLGTRECQHVDMRPSVLIVDDHADFRESASALLEAEGYEVVGAAADGETAMVEVERLRPEIVLVDIQLPSQLRRRRARPSRIASFCA